RPGRPRLQVVAGSAVFLQAVSGNKFIGYLLMIVFLVAQAAKGMLHFDHLLYSYNATTPLPYSDMNGYGHFLGAHLTVRAYWAALAVALLAVALLFWPRGPSLHWRARLRPARARRRAARAAALGASTSAVPGCGGGAC